MTVEDRGHCLCGRVIAGAALVELIGMVMVEVEVAVGVEVAMVAFVGWLDSWLRCWLRLVGYWLADPVKAVRSVLCWWQFDEKRRVQDFL